jgi:acetolactate synthase-1/2/3 large subunit
MRFPEELVAGIGSPGAGRFSLHALSQADVIFLLGTRMNFMLGFGQPPFISPQQKLIQLDIEPSEIGKNRAVDVGIVGDLKVTLKFMNDILKDFPSRPKWIEQLDKERTAFQKELTPLKTSKSLPIHPLRLIEEIEEMRSPDSILVLDGANSALWAILGIRPRSEGQVLFSPSGDLEAIGAGIPHALALKLRYPERDVILHTGDGSFGFCAMEIETAVRYGIPFVTVVHNDQGWGMTRDMQIEFFGKKRQVGNALGMVRYDRMVEALGGHGEFVEKPEDIRPALERALASGLPACVNVMVDPKPKSPGLIMWILLEIMLGKTTYLDKIPDWVEKLEPWRLSGLVSPLILKNLASRMHSQMK